MTLSCSDKESCSVVIPDSCRPGWHCRDRYGCRKHCGFSFIVLIPYHTCVGLDRYRVPQLWSMYALAVGWNTQGLHPYIYITNFTIYNIFFESSLYKRAMIPSNPNKCSITKMDHPISVRGREEPTTLMNLSLISTLIFLIIIHQTFYVCIRNSRKLAITLLTFGTILTWLW